MLSQAKKPHFTLAQQSNFLGITAKLYDHWRVRSLAILGGQNFSLDQELQLMLDGLLVQPGQTFLDVGTSTGNYARALQAAGANVTAIDISPAFLNAAKQNPKNHNIVFQEANAEALPYANSSFDGVVVGATLNEFFHTEIAVEELLRVLKPGGKIFFMYLAQSETVFERGLQVLLQFFGLRFPQRQWLHKFLQQRNLHLKQEKQLRSVCMQLFLKGQDLRPSPNMGDNLLSDQSRAQPGRAKP